MRVCYMRMRYIDDVLGVWTHREGALDEFLAHINGSHPNINFTMESTTNQGGLALLDTLITLKHKCSTEGYIEPTSLGVLIHLLQFNRGKQKGQC